MDFKMTVTAEVKNREPMVQSLIYKDVTKSRLRRNIQNTYPFGSWFMQDLIKKGKAVVSVTEDGDSVGGEVEDWKVKITYELKEHNEEIASLPNS